MKQMGLESDPGSTLSDTLADAHVFFFNRAGLSVMFTSLETFCVVLAVLLFDKAIQA